MRFRIVTSSHVAMAGGLLWMASIPSYLHAKTVPFASVDGMPQQAFRAKAASGPAPVQDTIGTLAVYAPAEVSQRDVFGQLSDFSSRAVLLGKAVRIRDGIWEVLGVRRARPPEALQIQIVCTAEKTPDAGQIRIVEANGRRVVRLRFPESEKTEGEDFSRSMIVAVLKELMMRSALRGGGIASEEKSVPRWLVDALLHRERCPEVIQFSDELSDSIEESTAPVVLSDLISRTEEDVRSSSRSQVLAARSFLSFLEAGSKKNMAVVEWLQSDPVRIPLSSWSRFFSSLPSSEAEIHRAWSVHVAALRAQRTRVSMTRAETERALERLLEIDVILPGNVRQLTSLEKFEEYVRLPGIESLLRARKLEFLALASKGHFLFEPVILAYADLCGEISARRTKRLNERFRSVRSEWEGVRQRLENVRDYLNWWESLPRSAEPAPELKDFYRELDEADAFRRRVSKALDGWEKSLEQSGRRADWKRIIEEADQRARQRTGE